ncbi:FecR domain-containing protein [Rubritalea tangerina]
MAAAAACLTLGLTIAWVIKLSRSSPPYLGVPIHFADGSLSSFNPNESDAQPGQTISISHGAASLECAPGVQAIILAPAEFTLIDDTSFYLNHGRATFTVAHSAIGFKVTTPELEVVDLGTQFTVLAPKHAPDAVHVSSGSVEASPLTSTRHTLTAGQAMRINPSGALAPIDYRASTQIHRLPPRVTTIYQEDFEKNAAEDNAVSIQNLIGWHKNITGPSGTFNPSSHSTWYQGHSLDDSSPHHGLELGMKGSNLGFFLTHTPNSYIEYSLENVGVLTQYTVSLTLGTRALTASEPQSPVIVSLVAGSTTLATYTHDKQTPNSFTTATLQWTSPADASDILGVPLKLRIALPNKNKKRHTYADFDNIRVSKMRL